jgi:5-methylcytosine-specific restriction protein A
MLGKDVIARDFERMTGLGVTLSEPAGGVIELAPISVEAKDSFVVRATQRQRKLVVDFIPGTFAAPLVEAMGEVDEQGVALWEAQATGLAEAKCTLSMTVNGSAVDPFLPVSWPKDWRFLSVSLARNLVALDDDDLESELQPATHWIAGFGALMAALLPMEAAASEFAGDLEGDERMVRHKRYERSPRNRAAAIAIHGYDCKGCDTNLGKLYGELGQDYIEIHHLTPLSSLEAAVIVDPRTDLVPLCPTCHRIVHRRRPPYTIADLRSALGLLRNPPG